MQEYTEDALIEQPTIAIFAALGYATIKAQGERFGSQGTLGRDDTTEVVLTSRLRAALQRLNPGLASVGIDQAVEALTRDRGLLPIAKANQEVYTLLKDGITVTVPDKDGGNDSVTVRVIDWNDATNNDFLLVSQFTVQGTLYRRRPDLVAFVNGLPLVVIELKALHRHLAAGYTDNIRDYKETIPALFWYNAAIIVSNGDESKIGSLSSGWEHYFEWKKINDEGEQGVVALDTMLRGVCDKARLLDIVENFTLFRTEGNGLVKLLARNHQYLGVNNAFASLDERHERGGRLGVFWHTQGSGKSLSMVFFAQKVFRKRPGNWTFLIVTDRDDLDTQIYKTFARTGAANEIDIQATSGVHLQTLLGANHRYIFTLIQKFQTEEGRAYPILSERDDIIVMTDEAHRTQYATLAQNMRNALPNAAYIGFTGTPLLAGEEKTRAVFGDYVSIYNFRQSIEDGATVPLYYENRIPSLQLTNDDLDSDIAEVVEEAGLDDAQQQRLEREFARAYHLITRDDRLDTIAADIVSNFLGHGEQGKAMVVAIDKQTAVRMYNKVRHYWQIRLDTDKKALLHARAQGLNDSQIKQMRARVTYMNETDMAVVVSPSQNEIADFKAKGLDIEMHRRRMVKEDLEEKFKDAADPLRIVFVCAMWMTGFDVPSLNTIYLDKPMRNHTLMQTIARANRVDGTKTGGVIVDYIGVFRNLQKALAIYGTSSGGSVAAGDMPVQDKAAQLATLTDTLTQAETFCQQHEIDCVQGCATTGLARVAFIQDGGERLLINDETRNRLITLANALALAYRAMLPDPAANAYSIRIALIVNIGRWLQRTLPEVDISGVLADVEEVLNASIAADSYVIREEGGEYNLQRVDLSQLDPDRLRELFAQGHQRTEATRLRNDISERIKKLVQLNKTRTSYLERFQQLIDEYNAGSMNVNAFFEQLVTLTRALDAEEHRAIAEHLSEEELAIVDLIANRAETLSEQERTQVKQVAQALVATLRHEKLVLDWRKRQQARAAVHVAIEDAIYNDLPARFTEPARADISAAVYEHVLNAYRGDGVSNYT